MAKFTITAQLNLQAGNVGQVVKQLQQQFQGANVNFNVKQIAAAQNQLNKTSVAAQGASKSVNGLAKNIADAAKRFSALAIATGTFVGLARSIKNAVGDAIAFERKMVKIAQATGQSVASLKSLEQEISKVSTTLGVSSKELIGAARTLTQAGFAANKVRDALNLLAKTELAATFDSIADTTEGVIAILNQFGQAAQKNGTEIAFLERSLSAINQVSKEFAVESSDLITAVRTTGSAFQSAGGSLDELLALFTSVRSTTRESAESIATGFRTIFTRTQRVDTINNLKKLGIELQDAEGKFVGPIEATRRLSAALSTIDPKDFRFNIIVEELGGFRQVSKVIPLIQQFSTTTKALAVAQKASGSLAEDAATAQQALAVQISKVREQFLAFIRDLTQSGPFQSTIKALLDISSAFIRVADTLKPILPMIAAFGAVKLGAAFLPALNSSFKRKNSGGIIGFASGGLVPGEGNGDTVPAMLTPGEFVIRKSSVKKLGVENLARANKYAGGGPISALPGKSIQAQINKKQKDGSSENVGIINDTFAMRSFDKRQIAIYDRVKNNETSFYARAKNKNGNGLTGKRVELDKSHVKELFTNNKTSANQFEKIVANVTGGTLQTTKKSDYPVDIIKGDRLIDVKYTPPESYEEPDGLSKALNYELSIGIPKYKYAGKNDNITLTNPNFLGTPLTAGKDDFKSEKDFSFYFPSFNLSKNGVEKLNVKAIAKRQISQNLTKIKSKLNKAENSDDTVKYLTNLQTANQAAKINLPSGNFAIRGDKSQINALSPYSPFKPGTKKANGGIIEYLALGGPAGKSRAARAITIPRIDSYTFDKPAGVDLDSVNSKKQQYKLNAEDRLDYDVNNVNVDVSKLKVSEGLLEQYNTADDQKRGYRFEDILKETGMAKSLSQVSNARLDGITAAGDPFEAKSRKSAIAISELEDKLYGAISDSISDPEKLARARFNANDLTKNEDHIKIGKITVFEDITRGLGAAVKSKARMGYEEEAAAKEAKEQNKVASFKAQQTLQDLVKDNFGSGFIIKGKQYSPVTPSEKIHPDVPTTLNQLLGGSYKDKMGTQAGQGLILAKLKEFIVRNPVQKKASGGSIADLAWLASGGAASGTDTVPAMLTPGEYVINKKSAQAIGYSNLNRMNKVGKFANGGAVDPQRMFFGGLKNRGVPASQQATNLISNSQATVSAKGQAAIVKVFDEIALNGGNTSAALKLLNTALKQSSGSQLKATKDFKNQLREAGKEAPKQLSTSLLLLSSVAGSVATDFTGLGDASKTAITSLITTFGVYQAITQSAADGLKDFGGTTAKIGKGLEKAGLAVAGLQAVAQAYSAYQQAKAKESSDKISKELELAASGKGNLNTITQESKKLGAASSNVSAVKSVTSLEAQILGTVGGVIGSAFGPIGTAAGLAVGTAAGAGINRYLNPPIKDAGSLFAQVNTTLFESDRALFKFNQQAEKFGEMNFNQVVATASAAALQYVNIQKELTKVNADLKNDPTNENLKLVSGQLGERLKNAGVAIDKSVSELNNKARKQIQQSARSGEALDLNKLFDSILAPTKERLKPSLESKDKSIVATAEKELADTTLELQRSLNADIAQILRQEAALKREEEARKAIIGSLLDGKAIKDSSVKFQFAVENLSDSVDFASSIFEKGLDFKGAGFFQKIAKSFELNTPTKEFQQGLSLLGSALGDKGAALGGKLQDLQIVTANLDTAFTQLQGRGIGGGINTEKFLKDYFGSLGANANGTVVNQFIKTITSKVLGENKSSGAVPGVITPELRKEIEATFNDFSKIITEQAQAIAGAFATYEDQLSSQLAKYAKTVESFINYQADTSDGFKKFNDVLAQATGRRVTLGEKEGFRQQKAGILGISDPRTLAKQLAESQNKMMNLRSAREQTPLTNRKDIELYQRSLFDLKIKTDQTVKSLESLADQSEKTGDILSEIERIRGQREAVQGLTKRFTFGTDQERGDITKSIQALQQVFATGNIGSIPEELRGAVSGLLDEFKDVPLFNGMTGEDVSKKLQYNQLVQAGVNPQAAQSIFTASSPEKKLINQLQATFMQEQEARRILAEQQFNQQDLLINSIDTLNMNFDKFLTGIFSGGRMQQMQGGAAQNALNNQGVQPVMAANADITIQQANIFDARAKMAERQQAAAQKRAKGGLIYRAGGGSIFQPQGTDTVPAMLTPGEYVIQKSAVDSVGVDTLDHINGYARGGLVSYLQLGGMASRRDQLRSMPNNMLAPMAGGEDAEANSEITYRNLMNTHNARTAAQMGMPGGVSDQRGNEVVANARYRNIMSGNASANQNLIPSRAGGDNGMAAANRYYSRIANIRGKSMQEAAQEYYQQQQGQMMSAPIYSDAEINMTNNSQMGGIAGFRQNQFQRQMAVRQNFMGNQFAQRSNFMGNQFMQRSSYMNMTRLSPKQKRLLREQQMGVGGGMANNGGSAPVDSYAQSVAQNANDGQGLMPGQRVVTTAAGGTRVVRDLRGQNRKQDRERRESQFAQYGTTRDADYLEKVDQAEAMRGNERQSLRVAQDNARNANDAQFNINKVQARAIKNQKNSTNFRGMVVPSAGIEDSAATNTWYGNFGAFRRGEADVAQGTTNEFIRSAGVGLGKSATGLAAFGAGAVDLTARQFGVQGNYAGRAVGGVEDFAFGSGARSQTGYTIGNIAGNIAQGGAGATGGLRGAGRAALSRNTGLSLIQGGLELGAVNSNDPRLREAAGGVGLLGMAFKMRGGLPNKLPNIRRPKFTMPSLSRSRKSANAAPKNTSNVSAGRKVGTANSYINQNLTEQGLSYRGGISPYSPQGTAMRREYLYPSGASTAAGRKVGGQTVPNYIPTQWRASGGLIDSVPAMLTPGEYVMSSSSVQKHGTNFMNRLNRGGKVKGFATGGAVGAMTVGASNNNSNDMSGNISALSEAFQQGASIIATAFNFEALNNIAGVFASFTESMTKISESLNGMTMTHQVTVDGQLNIAGLNIATIADAVKQEVSNLVANEVSRITGNDAKKMNPNG